MKILFLLTQDLESPSGLGRYFPLAKGLAGLGHQVCIAALHANFSDLPQKRFTQEGVKVWYVGQMHVQKQGNQKTYFSPWRLLRITIQATWALSKAALSAPADIIHIGKPHPMNSLAGRLAKIIRRLPIFLDCDDYEAGSGKFSSRWQKSVVAGFENWTPRWVNQATTNTRFMENRLIQQGLAPERVTYLPNGFDRDRFHAPEQNELEGLRARLGLQGKKVVLYVGSLSLASHAVNLLVDAFEIVHARLPETALLIVGGGEDFGKLKDMVNSLGLAEQTRFTGRMPADQVAAYYRLGNVSVDPVLDDEAAKGRSPLKLFESWASGVPFVTADVGERSILLGDPPAGVLTPPGKAELLAEGILAVLQNADFASQLVRLGYERAAAYAWERQAAQMEKIYRQFIHG